MKKIIFILLMISIVLFADTEFSEPKPAIDNPRKIVFSISSASDKYINHALSSANNVLKFYGPENVEMEIIAYYHGIQSLLKKNSKIAQRVQALMMLNVEFVACANSLRTKNIKKEELIEGTRVVTSGLVEVTERIKSGWIYIVP